MSKMKTFAYAYQLLYCIPWGPNEALMFGVPKDSIIWKVEKGDEKGQQARYPTKRY